MYSDDDYKLRSLSRSIERAELEGRSIQNAFESHPVVRYVMQLPVESPLYPAIGGLNYHERSPKTIPQSKTPLTRIRNRKSKQGIISRAGSTLGKTAGSTAGNSPAKVLTPPILSPEKHAINWFMPGSDHNRPITRGCGIIKSKDGSPVFTACGEDHDHYIKAKKKHCWSRHCSVCMNDTCIRNSMEVEKGLLEYKKLSEKEGNPVGDIGHFVVSPPQHFMKLAMQTFEDFDTITKYIECQLQEFGASAGYTIFHPWRQKSMMWRLSPHFHFLLYGYIDTNAFRKKNKGWVIKKIHPKEKIRSIHLTAAYLLTHAALSNVEKHPEDIDWNAEFLDYIIPDRYNDNDYNLAGIGKGRMVGDLSDMDWEEWIKGKMYKIPRTRYWGGASRRSIVQIDNYRQYKIRLCKECGSFLRVYEGFNDHKGDYVRYIQDNPVVCFARNAPAARAFILRYKSRLRDDVEMTLADLVRMMPIATTTLEFMPQNNDLVMDGPFDEPDSFFLKRQAKAIGIDNQTISF